MGVIEAFKKAFPSQNEQGLNTGEDEKKVGLVLKVNNVHGDDLNILKNALKDYKNIYYITDTLSKVEVNSLIADVDVFVSLHRAEGFGLVMAEAMVNGTICIATNWSSNTEFMNKDVAYMVPYRVVTIQKTNVQYKEGYHWAEPDIDVAAAYMKEIIDKPEICRRKVDKAKEYIEEKLSLKNQIALIETRIMEIYGR
jgi:glycosyltransferase involved in cell wall biosynthesis